MAASSDPAAAELHLEYERSIRNVVLVLGLVSILYWISFLLFLQDRKRAHIPAARRFAATVTLLENDQAAWHAQYLAALEQVEVVGQNYLQKLGAAPVDSVLQKSPLDLSLQLRIEDRQLLGLINRLNATSYVDLLTKWLDELRQLRTNRIVHLDEVFDLYDAYYTLNQSPGWLTHLGHALGANEASIRAIPPELDHPAWSERAGTSAGLFLSLATFEAAIHDLQTLYQGPIKDEMQTKTITGAGIWLQNLDSGRSIAEAIANREPEIRLPLLGEHVTGRWAFYLAPVLYLLGTRYLRLLARQAEVPTSKPFPHMLNLLRRGSDRRRFDDQINRTLILVILLFPISTCLPVAYVSLTVTQFPWIVLVAAGLALFGVTLIDTRDLVRLYTRRQP